jgi:hypothetical protein
MLLLKLAPVWVCFLLCFLLARLAARRIQIIPDWRLFWTMAALATGVLTVLIAEVVGAFDALDRITLAIAWTGVDLVLIGALVWKFRAGLRELASAVREAPASSRSAGLVGRVTPTRTLYSAGLGLGLFLGVISLQAPTFVWDCKSYHVPRILAWAQNKSLRPFPTSDIRRVAYDPGAEIAATTLYLLDGSDQPINLVSWFSVVNAAILASFGAELILGLFAERTGREWPAEKSRLAGAFAFVMVLTIPEGLIQAISTENDSVAAMWNLSLVCMTILVLRNPKNLSYIVALGLSLALGVCTKVTTFISAAPFLSGAFALLACRRFYQPALKLAAVVAVSVTVINAPWLTRNYMVFRHFLGPPNLSAENVNPSFGLNRDVANIIRNLSIYTSTPSAKVTETLNDLARALIACTGRPADDPTCIVPYQDLNHATHYTMPGAASVENGDGFGDIHAWLILAGFLVLAAFPLRNALGFYAVGVCLGFVLSCVYLRWHPWLFRYHITYFVLALPVVAIALVSVARSAVIVFLAFLCVVNAGLVLGFNTQYPISAPFLNVTREQHQFGSNLQLHDSYIALAEDVIGLGCTNVLLRCETYHFDYGLWVCLRNRGFKGAIQEFLVPNDTARVGDWEVTLRTAMVFIGEEPPDQRSIQIGGRPQPLLEIEYLDGFGSVSAVFPSKFPGNWWRLVGSENRAGHHFTLSGADGIGPDKPAEIHFSGNPVDRYALPLTNNIIRVDVGRTFADVDLRRSPLDVGAVVTESSVTLSFSLLQPVPPNKRPAFLANPQLFWKWAKNDQQKASSSATRSTEANLAPLSR